MIEIWINCPDRKAARKIADALIAERLIACANVFPQVDSVYRWNGKIENEPEVPLVVKTRADCFEPVADAVRQLHPYETPGIIGVPVERVNGDYLDWIYTETGREA